MTFSRKLLVVCSMLVLAACDSDNNNRANQPEPLPVELFGIQVLHASPDAPAVNVLVNGGEVLSGVDYKVGSGELTLDAGTYTIQVDGILPGGNAAVIGPVDLDFAADTIYTIVAVNEVAEIEPVVISQPDVPVTAGSARLFVLHATPGAAPDFSLPVDVYVDAYSEPNAPIGTSAPLTFDFKETLGPIEVPAGEYQVRVTLAGTQTVVYDSARLPLGDGDDLTLAAVPNVSGGPAAVSLVALNGGGSVEFLDVNTPTSLQVVHASPDAPAVDVVVDGGVLVPGLAFPDATGFVEVPAATYNVAVTVAGNPGAVAIGPVDLDLAAGTRYSVLAVGELAAIEPLILTDDPRRVATNAKVRIVHAAPSPAAAMVDIYVTAVGADINDETPAFTDVEFKDNTGFIGLAEGDYDVTVAVAGTKTAAIGPATISIANGGIYTAVARDPLPGAAEFGLIVLDDFVAP